MLPNLNPWGPTINGLFGLFMAYLWLTYGFFMAYLWYLYGFNILKYLVEFLLILFSVN